MRLSIALGAGTVQQTTGDVKVADHDAGPAAVLARETAAEIYPAEQQVDNPNGDISTQS